MTKQPITPGFYPFWFWNDALEEAEIRWQIQRMAEQGIEGFYIHPRQGLKTPYLSDAFFHMVQTAMNEAKKHGMTVQLYDEYPYPSGVAGGEVFLGKPQYMATRLVQQTRDVTGGDIRWALPAGRVLSCVAYRLKEGKVDWTDGIDLKRATGIVLTDGSYIETGLTQYNRKTYMASGPTPVLQARLPGRPYRVFVSVQAVVEGHKYWNHFIDVLNPDAVREFIRLTHEAYKVRFSDEFGTGIQSIFVDETTPGWSDLIPEAFMDTYGYDLLPLLPALQDQSHPKHTRVAKDLHRLTYDMFVRSFERPIGEWCRHNGILYAGEKNSLRFSQLRYSDVPGCDPGHTKAGADMDILGPSLRDNARATASAAYFYDKPGSLCECYHSLGWSGTLQDAKLIAEGLLLMGIDWLVPHGFFYSTHSLKKHDAPPSFFFQMPYWPLFHHLSRRVDRIAEQFFGTYIDAQLLVVDPTAGLPSEDDLAAYKRLLDLLVSMHIDFLIVDTDVLARVELEKNNGGSTSLRVKDVSAKGVVVPPMSVVEQPLKDQLRRLSDHGGTVITLERDFEIDKVKKDIFTIAKPAIDVDVLSGQGTGLSIVTRRKGHRRVFFMINTAREHVDVAFGCHRHLKEIPLTDGLPPMLEKTGPAYHRTIAPFESVMLRETPEDRSSPPPALLPIEVTGAWRIERKNPNLLRMGRWHMTVLDSEGNPTTWAPVEPMPIANQLAESGVPFSPRFHMTFGQNPRMTLPKVAIRYKHTFRCDYDGRVFLVMEPGSLAGRWSIRLNDAPPMDEKALIPVDAHVRGSLGWDITEKLRLGTNHITVDVTTDRWDGGLVNPLYLSGDFAVKFGTNATDSARMTQRIDMGRFNAWEHNGLPYYAGVVDYTGAFQLTTDDVRRAFSGVHGRAVGSVDFDVPFDDACQVSINGGPWHTLPWSPRYVPLGPDDVRIGKNDIRIRVYTTLIRSFEGQRFDIPRHAYETV